MTGFQVSYDGPLFVQSKNDFKPADSDRTYFSVELGYMGGSIRVSCTHEIWATLEEGAQIADMRAQLTSKSGKLKVELVSCRPVRTRAS